MLRFYKKPPRPRDSCFWVGDDYPWLDRGRCIDRDGGYLQVEPFKNQPNLIYRMFYSDDNINYIQTKALEAGFNAPPDARTLRSFMDTVYQDDMPYGAFNRLDPNRDNRSLEYAYYYVDRLNQQLMNRVFRNMAVMKMSQYLYNKDLRMHGTRGVMEIDRPINTECKFGGDQIRLDFRLPQPYPGN